MRTAALTWTGSLPEVSSMSMNWMSSVKSCSSGWLLLSPLTWRMLDSGKEICLSTAASGGQAHSQRAVSISYRIGRTGNMHCKTHPGSTWETWTQDGAGHWGTTAGLFLVHQRAVWAHRPGFNGLTGTYNHEISQDGHVCRRQLMRRWRFWQQ